MSSESRLAVAVIHEVAECLDYGRVKIEHCLGQLTESQVWWRPREEMNSIANLLQHIAGNLCQWIVAGVGDLEDTRDRQREFDDRSGVTKAELMQNLCDVLDAARNTMAELTTDELLARRRIQGHDVTKLGAIWHSVTHFQGHVQEIIGMTRQQLGSAYEFQWAPTTKDEGAARCGSKLLHREAISGLVVYFGDHQKLSWAA